MNNKNYSKLYNIIKLVSLPVYVVAVAVVSIVPRNKKLWVFGRKTGYGEGPVAVMKKVNELHPEIKTIWIAQSNKEAIEINTNHAVKAVAKSSLAGFWYTLRAKVIVLTHGIPDVNYISIWGGFVVNLWHGSPLKKILLDFYEKKGANKILLKIYSYVYLILYNIIVSPSNLITYRYKSSLGMERRGRVKLLGDPRCDIIIRNNNQSKIEQCRKAVEKQLTLEEHNKLILFAPTWREYRSKGIVNLYDGLKYLSEKLENTNYNFVLRLHPNSNDERLKQLNNIYFFPSNEFPDINEWLPVFDVLVTDYSGIAMDYSLLERPIVFYAPDLEEYEAKRGLYEDYHTFTSGHWCETWEEVGNDLLKIIKEEGFEKPIEAAKNIKNRYQTYSDGKNSERVVNEIVKQIGL